MGRRKDKDKIFYCKKCNKKMRKGAYSDLAWITKMCPQCYTVSFQRCVDPVPEEDIYEQMAEKGIRESTDTRYYCNACMTEYVKPAHAEECLLCGSKDVKDLVT